MLNALAYSCRCVRCTQTAPCINLLDEMNVFELRQAWTTDCLTAGYDYAEPNMQEKERFARVHAPALNFWFGGGDIFICTY